MKFYLLVFVPMIIHLVYLTKENSLLYLAFSLTVAAFCLIQMIYFGKVEWGKKFNLIRLCERHL